MQKLENFKHKWMIINVDQKAHKNIEAFVALAADRALSLERKSESDDLILDVLAVSCLHQEIGTQA